MTLAPRFLINFWFGYCVSRFARRLHARGQDVAGQAQTLTHLLAQSADTHFGRQHGLTAKSTYAEFRTRVPPRMYADFAPFVQRMMAGEPDVLSPGRCLFFVESEGNLNRTPKQLPVPETMLQHYRLGLRAASFLHALKVGHHGVFLGRHLQLGASTTVREENTHYFTNLDGMLALCLSPWADANLHAPPAAIARLPAGPDKDAAIVRAMRTQDVTLIAGAPADICALAFAARQLAGSDKKTIVQLQALWPNLECLLFTGAAPGLHEDTLHEILGPAVNFHEVYLAAEGIIAAQDNAQPPGLRLLTDLGIFFEFLPLAHYHESSLATAGERCLPLAQVQPDVDYVLLLTTPAGLCRYVVGDIVRFLSVDPPRLQVISRLHSQLNLCGEQVSERELIETLLAVCRQNDWQPVNFHVAPYVQRIAAGQTILCHEWWIELRPRTIKTPTANVISPGLDAGLRARNSSYATKRASRRLAEPCVRLVMPGVFTQWAQQHHPSASASKMLPSRSDRQIADQLAALAGFHQATAPTFSPAEDRLQT